jgi:hypothetical protein
MIIKEMFHIPKFSHFFNLRACKNDNFLFIMETSSLEARNIWFVGMKALIEIHFQHEARATKRMHSILN